MADTDFRNMADPDVQTRSLLVRRDRKRPVFPKAGNDEMDKVFDTTDGVDDGADEEDGNCQDNKCDKSFLLTMYQITSYLFFAVLYIFDCGSDLWAASIYYKDREAWHFSLTVFVVVLSAVTMNVLNLVWYYGEYKNIKKDSPDDMPPKWVWVLRIVLSVCLLGPFLRCIEISFYGVKARRVKHDEGKKNYYEKLIILAIQDMAILGLIESFIESAPQLCVQLFIMQTQGPETNFRLFVQTASCLSSWFSCAFSLVSYSRANRAVRPSKEELKIPAMLTLFLWRLFTIGPRILALALFASLSQIRYYSFVAVACHWIIMFIYIVSRQTGYCNNKVAEVFFSMIAGFTYIFTFWNLEDGHTRYRYITFYILMYIQNLGMVITWFVLTTSFGLWYYYPGFIFVIIGFPLGIAFMIIYYKYCHPENIKLCLFEDTEKDIEELEKIRVDFISERETQLKTCSSFILRLIKGLSLRTLFIQYSMQFVSLHHVNI